MPHKNIAVFRKLCVLIAGEGGLPGTGMGNRGQLVKFTGGNWKVVIGYYLPSEPVWYAVSLSSHGNDFEPI